MRRVEAPGSRKNGGRCSCGGAQRVSGEEADADQRGFGGTHGRQERHELRKRSDEMRRGTHHDDVALDGALSGNADVARGEVTQSAVYEFRAPAAGAEREVVAFGEHDAQSSAGGIESDTRAGDATADDEDVDGGVLAEFLELAGAAGGVQGARPGGGHHRCLSVGAR